MLYSLPGLLLPTGPLRLGFHTPDPPSLLPWGRELSGTMTVATTRVLTQSSLSSAYLSPLGLSSILFTLDRSKHIGIHVHTHSHKGTHICGHTRTCAHNSHTGTHKHTCTQCTFCTHACTHVCVEGSRKRATLPLGQHDLLREGSSK